MRESENESAGIDTTSSTKISGRLPHILYGGSRNHAGWAVLVFLNNLWGLGTE